MAHIDKTQFNDNFQYFDKEIVLGIIDIFINEYPDRVTAISDSIDKKDYDAIKFNSHSIKGVIANFIAPEVEQRARELEIMGTTQNIDGIEVLFSEFKLLSAEMVEELKVLKNDFK